MLPFLLFFLHSCIDIHAPPNIIILEHSNGRNLHVQGLGLGNGCPWDALQGGYQGAGVGVLNVRDLFLRGWRVVFAVQLDGTLTKVVEEGAEVLLQVFWALLIAVFVKDLLVLGKRKGLDKVFQVVVDGVFCDDGLTPLSYKVWWMLSLRLLWWLGLIYKLSRIERLQL
jgi:hypothetical protein